jgi:uncharacterized membrane protein YdjX (TVP38/TMEM64 family)
VASDAVARLRRVMLIRVGVLFAVAVGVLVAAYAFGWIDMERVEQWSAHLRDRTPTAVAALIFVGTFGVLVAVGFPATPLLVAGGLVFGTLLGTLLNIAGAVLGSTAGYFLARGVARGPITKLLSGRAGTVLQRTTGFSGVLRLRLLPVIPMAAISYAAGVARVGFLPFVTASTLGMSPSAWSYAYLADGIVAGATGAGVAALERIAIAGGILLVLSVVPRLLHRRSQRP